MSAFFWLLAAGHIAVLTWGARRLRDSWTSYALFIVGVTAALAFDNFVLGLGGFLEEGPVLEFLNGGRFWTHALLTPTMMVAALGMLRMTGVAFARTRSAFVVGGLFSGSLVLLGTWVDIVNLELEPVAEYGITRYVNAFELMPGPPIPALLTIIVVIVAGVILWRRSAFAWLALGGLTMFGTAAAGGLLVGNTGEVVFAASLMAGMVFATGQAEKLSVLGSR